MIEISKPVCPDCKTSENVKEIVYGLPSGEDFDNSEIILGGCLVFDGQPSFACTKCGWDDSRDIFKERLIEE